LPDELLQQPVMQALMAGSPAAASAKLPEATNTELGKLIAANGPALQTAGFGFYRSQDGNYGVIFNQLKANPQEIVSADQQGQLLQVAPPVEQIEQAIGADPAANPVLTAGEPGGAAQAAQGAPAPTSPAPAPGGRVQKALFQTRKQALTPGGPTSGPKPGGGRVLNALLKPVV
jgi:hypothetical protein